MTDKVATLTLPHGDSIELPVLQPQLGNDVIDVGSLKASGYFSYDPGFVSTASTESKITFIDGEAGTLLYRGYPIEQLAEQCDFMEVCHLLMFGELPNASQAECFTNKIKSHTMVHEQMRQFLSGFRRDAHPMAVMVD